MSICLYSWTVYCIAGLLSEHCNLFRISEGLLNYSACPHIVLILPRFSVIFYYLSLTFSWSINVLFVLLLSLFSVIFYYLSVDQSIVFATFWLTSFQFISAFSFSLSILLSINRSFSYFPFCFLSYFLFSWSNNRSAFSFYDLPVHLSLSHSVFLLSEIHLFI